MIRQAPFSITPEAREQLETLLADFEGSRGRKAIPALIWIDSELNDGKVPSGIAIGYYLDRHEIENDILSLDDLEIVLAVPDDELHRFVGKVLDHDGAEFVMISNQPTRLQ